MGDARTDPEPVSLFQGRDPGALLPETGRDNRPGRRLDKGPGEGRDGETDDAERRGKTVARVQSGDVPEDLPAAEGETDGSDGAGLRQGRRRRGGGENGGRGGGGKRRCGGDERRHRYRHGENGERHV